MALKEAPLESSLWPEETVEYRIYCPGANRSQDKLTELALECNLAARRLSAGHIWHYAPFGPLRLITGTPSCLMGRTCFQDNIQDEWFIVHILFGLSELFQGITISVVDGDGQLLLIEAAHYLEKWMNPEEMKNRVFIHKGRVHIIPKPRSPAEIGLLPVTTPIISEAIELVENENINTKCSSKVQESIDNRLACFKGVQPESLLHRTHCILPSLAAYVLLEDRQLVSAACHALIDRSPSDMQACQNMKFFSPKKHSMVTSEVYFTRFLYAQLTSLKFCSPRNEGFSMPPQGSLKFKECDLGMKLTCGLEILLHHANSKSTTTESSRAEDHQLWPQFLNNLKKRDYFHEEIEGSKVYQERMQTAKEFFLQQCPQDKQEEVMYSDTLFLCSMDPLVLAGRRISQILQESTFLEDEVKERIATIPPPDDDSWMDITEEKFDTMMQHAAKPPLTQQIHDCFSSEDISTDVSPCNNISSASPTHTDIPTDTSSAKYTSKDTHSDISTHLQSTHSDISSAKPISKENSADLQSIVFGMKSFIDKVSSHSGAELPWCGDDPSNLTAVDFDEDSFLEALTSMLKTTDSHDHHETEEDDALSLEESGNSDEDEEEGEERELEEEMEDMKELMQMMDDELAPTVIGQSFEKVECSPSEPPTQQNNDAVGTFQPVDVDFNLVKNLLDSYSSQEGGAGPGSNLLHSLGINIPHQ